jgi:hypothetical protein
MVKEEDLVVRDEVEQWRWFPAKNEPISKTSSLEPSGSFQPRINNIKFRSGQTLADLYRPPMYMFFNSTAKRIKSLGYNFVSIVPPWQWIKDEPVPVVGNMLELGIEYQPNYPNDEMLIRHIRAFKDAGLKVQVAPIICCTEIDTEARTSKWWKAYFSEVERFLVHHAKVAERAGADSFLFELFVSDKDHISESRIQEMLKNVKNEFSGEIGTSVDIWMDEDKVPNGIIPEADFFSWADEIDFFVVSIDAAISFKDNPSDKELKDGAAKLLDEAKILYDEYRKPLMIRGTYYSGEQSWKGAAKYGMPHEIIDPVYGGADQARVVQAYFEAIKERPWVTGLFFFGYEYGERPLAVEWSVRGKPAEDLWQKWNRVIYEE